MLEFFHKHTQSVILYFIVFLVLISMVGFGVDFLGPSREDYVIKIDKHNITREEFNRERRALDDLYRMQLGDLYAQLAGSENWNINNQVVDRLIQNYLLDRSAQQSGLAAGDQEVREMLLQRLGGRFDPRIYEAHLRQIGQTAVSYEAGLRAHALRSQLLDFFRDMSTASRREALSALERDHTSYKVEFAAFDPEALIKEVPEPDPAGLEQYYTEHLTRYERPARAAYDYMVFDPQQHLDWVELSPEDIELYYAERQEEFMNPEEVKVSMITIALPEKADAKIKEETKARAMEVHTKAAGGEDFGELAKLYSDDLPTKFVGGLLGWIKRGDKDKKFEDAAFALKAPGIAELVSTPKGFFIIKVEEYKGRTPKPLAEVTPVIEKTLREREAPGYTSVRAHTYFEEWRKSGITLKKFAEEKGFSAASTPSLLSKDIDPDPTLSGLSAEVLRAPEDLRRLIEQKDKTVIVEVTQYLEADTPPFSEIRDLVLRDYKAEKAQKLARSRAEDLVRAAGENAVTGLRVQTGVAVQEKQDLKPADPGDGLFAKEEVRRAIFAAATAPARLAGPFEHEGRFFVVQVREIKKPDMGTLEEQVKKYQEKQSRDNMETLLKSFINQAKASSSIDIVPGLLQD